jgi:DNA-binding NarL/FixJ family response regulator
MKVLVADDHSIVRKGLIQLIEEMPEVSQIDESEDGSEVIEKVKSNQYDLLILDLSMPKKNGLDVLKDLKILNPNLNILVLSTYPEELFASRSLKAGASGYLTKNSAPEELVNAIRKVSAGRKYISSIFAESLADQFSEPNLLPHQKLSDRELQIFQMLAERKTSQQICEVLSLSNKTVSTHKINIFKKMGLNSVTDLVMYALRNNLTI